MDIKNKLYSNIILRSIFADFGGRTAYTKNNKNFLPYFQYKIGTYKEDYYLYFPKEPSARLYYNEIFSKLSEYNGYDISKYLDFHYQAYNDKADFLRFLHYEIKDRLHRDNAKSRKQKMQTAAEWLSEKQLELTKQQEHNIQKEIEKDMHSFLDNKPSFKGQNLEVEVKDLSEKIASSLSKQMTQILDGTEERLQSLTDAFDTGHIQINNRAHEQKIIELFVLLQQTQTGKFKQLFKKCAATDIAAILKLHFEAFKDKKMNTLQKKITESHSAIYESNNIKTKNLIEALEAFFAD